MAVVDVDFHHGNGTQDIFWDDPEVQYVSLHGDPAGHYPHFTGAADEVGDGPGRGTTRNLPLPDGTGDDAYLDALAEAMALVAAFDPATLVVSAGFDTFEGDPIGAFAVTTDGFRRIGAALAAAGRPMVLVQEGGYAVDALGANAVALLEGSGGSLAPGGRGPGPRLNGRDGRDQELCEVCLDKREPAGAVLPSHARRLQGAPRSATSAASRRVRGSRSPH